MRTTIDIPDDLHEVVREIAHERRESMSKVASELMRRGVESPTRKPKMTMKRGVPVISVGHPVTNEDVAALLDDE